MGQDIAEGTEKRERVGALDGLRGLAVAAVLAFHAQLPGARGGFLGVSAFFTLSGFLITSLLLDEHARTGRISLRAFWGRRVRRLLPAAYLALGAIVVFGATIATVHQARALRTDVLAAIADVANWHFLFAGRSYASLFSAPSPVLHFWSLAIEEQFYLLFPLLFLVALRLTHGRRVAIALGLGVGIASSIAASGLLYSPGDPSRVYYGTDTRAEELLVGALLAVVFTARTRDRVRRLPPVATTAAGAIALATMIGLWITVDQRAAWLYRGGFAVHAALTAIVIAAALAGGPFARALGWRPLALIGLVSYGIYLFHWPIYLWLSPERTGLATAPLFALRIAVTLTLAIASYVVIERPVVRGRRRVARAWPAFIAPVAAAALVGGLFVVTSSPPAPAVVLSALGDAPSALHLATPVTARPGHPSAATHAASVHTVKIFRPPARPRPLRILVVGDSVGITLGRGIELWARATGDAVVDNVARKYCPLGRGLPARQGLAENDSMQNCDWTTLWAQAVRDFDPDVVVVLFTVWEASPRNLPGTGWRQPGDPALDHWQLAEYNAAVDTLTARGAHIAWMNAPCTHDDAITHGSPLWNVDRRTIPRLAAARPLVHPIDLEREICPGDRFRASYGAVTDARPDGAHFSDAGALAVASWALPIVLGQAPVPRYTRS